MYTMLNYCDKSFKKILTFFENPDEKLSADKNLCENLK